ncbi:TonB-dependent receptor [Novosphingobium sp. FSY-8]|uniref:TonB-dependent receptor n=1 Tax=Novosphingobium ovatum TaxID=1908523 RepID=A0ABW9XA90_9SPHN|nr:TonB-dependent receptor [Novosphingobium ovatum]NBC35446.1 TonB-dependent receptor [Novosphingobium ovatum]
MKSIQRLKWASLACTGMVALMSTGTAFAADAPPATADDIVVTASRTASFLSKTPIAMTAVTGESLAKSGIVNPTQLDSAVPNLTINRSNGGLQITIRGVTSTDNTEKGDPSAAFMLNGVYIARPQSQEVAFFDVERVEVLRGPQGTLYGRNSTAGVVNVLSAKPKFQFGGSLEASYGNFNAFNMTGVINVPISSTLAMRAAVNYDRRNNYVIDGNPGDHVSLNPFKDNISARLSLLWQPTDALSFYVVGDYSKLKGAMDATVPPGNFYGNIITGARSTFEAPTFLDRTSADYRTLSNVQNQQSRRNNDDKGVMGEINYDLSHVRLTYVGSYRQNIRDEIYNYANGAVMAYFPGTYWQTSHELRAALINTGRLQAQVGGYYFEEQSNITLHLYNLLGPNLDYLFLRNPTIAVNKSVFGQATYALMDNLKFTAGVRYSSDTKSRYGSTAIDSYTSITNAYQLGTFLGRATQESTAARRTFSKTTWRLGLDYTTPLGLVFASVSTGYKAGGFNDGCEVGTGPGCNQRASALYYQPETLTAYEVGAKLRFSPAMRLNATLFHYDYQGLQLSQAAYICGPNGDLLCQITRNAASAKVDGVELDAELRPSENLSVHLAANYLDAHYAQFVPEPGVNFAGRPLDRSPKWTATVGFDYGMPVGDGRLVLSGQTRFSSRYEMADMATYAYFYQPAYTKSDLSLTYTAPKDRYFVSAYIHNIENNVVVTNATAGFFGLVSFGDPQVFGARVGVKF